MLKSKALYLEIFVVLFGCTVSLFAQTNKGPWQDPFGKEKKPGEILRRKYLHLKTGEKKSLKEYVTCKTTLPITIFFILTPITESICN
jgi:hypothetical protein